MAWSILGLKVMFARVDDTLTLAYGLVVERSDHADGCLVLGLGCSRRMGIVPLLVRKSP